MTPARALLPYSVFPSLFRPRRPTLSVIVPVPVPVLPFYPLRAVHLGMYPVAPFKPGQVAMFFEVTVVASHGTSIVGIRTLLMIFSDPKINTKYFAQGILLHAKEADFKTIYVDFTIFAHLIIHAVKFFTLS